MQTGANGKFCKRTFARTSVVMCGLAVSWTALGGCSSDDLPGTEAYGGALESMQPDDGPSCSAEIQGGAIRIAVSTDEKLTGNAQNGAASVSRGHAVIFDTRDGNIQTEVTVEVGGREVQQIRTQVNSDQTIHATISYLSPVQGVRNILVDVAAGGTAVATVDGRRSLPFAVPTTGDLEQIPEQIPEISFEDGAPGPEFRLNDLLTAEIAGVLSELSEAFESCAGQLSTATGGSFQTLSFEPGHRSDTNTNFDCLKKFGACDVGYVGCLDTFVTASLACGPFAWACAIGSVAGCTLAATECADLAAGSAACCPVMCRDGYIDVACCLTGETCIGDTGLCCSPGTQPCGGECCPNDHTCIEADGVAACLAPGGDCDRPCATDVDCAGVDCSGGNRASCNAASCCICNPA